MACQMGWSFFQQFPEFSAELEYETALNGKQGYFRKRDWFEDILGLILIGEHGEMSDQGILFEKSWKWALEVMRTEEKNGVHTNASADDAWAVHLLRDKDFRDKNETVLRSIWEVHNMAVGQVAENRWYGSCWLVNTYGKAYVAAPKT